MKHIILLKTICLTLVSSASALNILGIFPYPGKSHFMVFEVYLKELARRGHNVTVISHFPQKDKTVNYTDINISQNTPIIQDSALVEKSIFTLLGTAFFLANSGKDSCEVLLQNKQVQDIVTHKQTFDVVVAEQFTTDCGLAVAYKLRAPVVGISSHILMPWHYDRLGIPSNPSYVSFHFLEGGTNPSFRQRIERVLCSSYFKWVYYFIAQRSNANTVAKYYDDVPSLENLGREIKFHLLYHNFVLTGSKLFPANVIEVGGFHVDKAKPLVGDLKKFVDEAEHGVIFISFGSVVKSATMPKDKLNVILNVIKKLPQRFIWKWEADSILFDKNKLYVANWLPQGDILGHPKVLAFFSHAGMGGTTEAIHFGVPMVAMPFFGDQPSNSAAAEETGLGVKIDLNDFTEENIIQALETVLNPTFRQNVKKLSNAWHDRPMAPMDTAVFWTEFTARHPNMSFRTAAADVPLYQYLLLDVIGTFVIIFLGFIVILMVLTKPKASSKPRQKTKKN